MPLSEITATSEVPPPMSSTMAPRASCTGMPAPIAAAIGSSIRNTSRAPAPSADSLIARRTAEHALGLGTYRSDRARTSGTTILTNRHHRGLVEDDALSTHIDQRV